MRKATATAVSQFGSKPNLLPQASPHRLSGIGALITITFDLNKSFFEFNNILYKQNSGGTMGSPLIVELSEIQTATVQEKYHLNLLYQF